MSSDAEHCSGRDRLARRPHLLVLAGLCTALLCNAWLLEGALAKRSSLSGSWISDLAARSEAFGWRFELLEIASGLALAAFALLLLRPLGRRSTAMRCGVLALILAGLLTAIGGAAPLDCAEALDPRCPLNYDPLDVIHTIANVLEILATGLAFGLLGIGFRRLAPRHAAGRMTLALGILWLLLTALSALSYPSATSTRSRGSASGARSCSSAGGWCCSASGPKAVRARAGEVPPPPPGSRERVAASRATLRREAGAARRPSPGCRNRRRTYPRARVRNAR
jgi:hypothetical protein